MPPGITHLLNRKAELLRRQQVPNGQGGWRAEYVTHQDDVPIRFRPARAGEVTAAAQTVGEISHVVYAEIGSDIRRGDRLVTAQPPRDQEVILDVVNVRRPSPLHHLEIDATQHIKKATI